MANVTRTAGGSRANNLFVRIVIVLACGGGGAIVILFAINVFGAVNGIEFSPDTFASRTFVYYEIPLIRVRVTPVYRDSITGALQSRVRRGDKLTPVPTADPPRWHLVAMTKGRNRYEDDAIILYRYLHEEPFRLSLAEDRLMQSIDGGATAERWLAWTNDHNTLAKALWTAIAEACRRELYAFTPQLFALAEQMTLPKGTTPEVAAFEKAIARSMAEQYTTLADIRTGQGENAEAIEYYTAALEHDDEFREALSGRERAYYDAGESEKSKQDRQRLKELEAAVEKGG